jgi:hypothetical protein
VLQQKRGLLIGYVIKLKVFFLNGNIKLPINSVLTFVLVNSYIIRFYMSYVFFFFLLAEIVTNSF